MKNLFKALDALGAFLVGGYELETSETFQPRFSQGNEVKCPYCLLR